MFSHNSGFYLASALVCGREGGEEGGWDGTKFMGLEALRRETDVKIYLSAQKQAKESGVRVGQTRDCTDESMHV